MQNKCTWLRLLGNSSLLTTNLATPNAAAVFSVKFMFVLIIDINKDGESEAKISRVRLLPSCAGDVMWSRGFKFPLKNLFKVYFEFECTVYY